MEGKLSYFPWECLLCPRGLISCPPCPCLLLTVTQPDRSRSNGEAVSVKWLSCKYRLTWSRTLIMCELIQHSASSSLTSEGAWIIPEAAARGHLWSPREESGSHSSYTRVCVRALNHNPKMIFPSAKQGVEIVRDRIYGNGHKRWRLQK